MILELTGPIRDVINGPRMSYLLRRNLRSWNRLCSALDVIEDTDEAIRAFIDLRFPGDRQSDEMGRRYLAMYGVLQPLFIQQDALIGLHKSLTIPFRLKDHVDISTVRELRNGSIGHPTEQTRGQPQPSSNFLARITMDTPRDVLYMKAYADGTVHTEHIDILAVIAGQAVEVDSILSDVLVELRRRVEDHRERFKDDKMRETIPDMLDYALQKLSEGFYAPERAISGEWAVNQVQQTLDAVRSYLQRQDMDVDTFDFLQLIYDELTYPLAQLHAHFTAEPSTIADRKMGEIVAFYVKAKVDELKAFASDFDSDGDG
jgi:hypothetical protein